ncbi:hypothetical protein XH93_21520 [Bradyrhizobium sp. CCBAU 51753]|nr:hypothetical protein XH93_21520 [Bradyrhizobium sp. CCBAU 51753]
MVGMCTCWRVCTKVSAATMNMTTRAVVQRVFSLILSLLPVLMSAIDEDRSAPDRSISGQKAGSDV